MHDPAVSLVHVHQGCAETLDETVRRHVCHTRSLPVEVANKGLVEHVTFGIARGRDVTSTIGHTHVVRIDGTLRTAALLHFFHIDIVAVRQTRCRLALRIGQDLAIHTAAGSRCPLVRLCVVAFLPVGILVHFVVLLAAGAYAKWQMTNDEW